MTTTLDLRGLIPAPVTPFTRDGAVDYAAIQRLGSWLGSVPGVTGLTVLGHAGEGTFLERDEQSKVIEAFKESVGGRLPIIAGITLEGTQVAADEAKRAMKAGASAGLVYPSHGWLRFGYQKGAPQDRYRAIYEHSGLPLILFQYPDATKATYNLETMLEIAAQPGVFAMKNGVRNMKRWDTEIPVIRRERPNLQIALHGMPSHLVIEAVAAGQADLGYAVGPLERPGYYIDSIESPAVVVMPEGHRLASVKVVRPRDLAGEKIVGVAADTLFRSRVEAALGELPRSVPAETPLSQIACVLVSEGVGIAIVDPFSASEFVGRLVARPLRPEIDVGMLLLVPRQRATSALAQSFVSGFSAHLAGIRASLAS